MSFAPSSLEPENRWSSFSYRAKPRTFQFSVSNAPPAMWIVQNIQKAFLQSSDKWAFLIYEFSTVLRAINNQLGAHCLIWIKKIFFDVSQAMKSVRANYLQNQCDQTKILGMGHGKWRERNKKTVEDSRSQSNEKTRLVLKARQRKSVGDWFQGICSKELGYPEIDRKKVLFNNSRHEEKAKVFISYSHNYLSAYISRKKRSIFDTCQQLPKTPVLLTTIHTIHTAKAKVLKSW